MATQCTLMIKVPVATFDRLFKGKPKAARRRVIADPEFQKALAEDFLWAWERTMDAGVVFELDPFDQNETLYGLVPEKHHESLGIKAP